MIIYEIISWILLGVGLATMQLLIWVDRPAKATVLLLGAVAGLGGGFLARLIEEDLGGGAYSLSALAAAGAVAVAALIFFTLANNLGDQPGARK